MNSITMEFLFEVLGKSFLITSFIFVMMLVIEFVNVQTRGIWQRNILDKKWKRYLLAIFLGLIPGCLGAYTSVALFSHNLIRLGAITSTMIATSGDEAFFMLAMFPKSALLLMAILGLTGLLTAILVDNLPFIKKFHFQFKETSLPLHIDNDCRCFENGRLRTQNINFTLQRIALVLIPLLLLILVLFGWIEDEENNWIKSTLIITSLAGAVIVLITPDHFIEKHLWHHIVVKHIPKIFFWTLGTLVFIFILNSFINVENIIHNNIYLVLLFSILIGMIPSSGPHLVFATLFAQGLLPFSILLASSIAQDGHGMIPLLAESKRAFVIVKIINISVAMLIGSVAFGLGF